MYKTIRNSHILLLRPNRRYIVRCYDALIAVRHGLVTCFGFSFPSSPSSDVFYSISSLDGSPYLSISTGRPLREADVTAYLKKWVEGGDNKSLSLHQDVGAVIEVQQDTDNPTDVLRDTFRHLWKDESQAKADVDLPYFKLFRDTDDMDIISMSTSIKDCVTNVTDTITDTDVVVLCGPQNSGKSTLCRYLLNKILSRSKYHTLAYLDTDLGQAEFTPSGMVSLSVVSRPVLSLPYVTTSRFVPSLLSRDSTMCTVSEARCLGAPSPMECMKEYMEALVQLYSRSRELNMPLVVNCCGWTKGFGVALHADLLRLVKPSHVINLVTNTRKDLPDISELLVTPGIDNDTGQKGDSHLPLVANIPGRASLSKVGFQLRAMTMLNYFAKLLDTADNNKLAYPYKISFDDIKIHIGEDDLSGMFVPAVMNCSVVGLLGDPNDKIRSEVVQGMHVCGGSEYVHGVPCLGYGIIRAIDIKEKVFYLNTTLKEDQLDLVKIFKHTKLAVPFSRCGSAFPVPYVSNLAATEILGIGSRTNRSNLKRKYQSVTQ